MTSFWRCDHGDCYDHTTEPDDPTWTALPDGQHLCERHDTCTDCGHDRSHHRDWPDSNGCDMGEVQSNTDIRPGRAFPDGTVIDWLWFGHTFVVKAGCGCARFKGRNPSSTDSG